MKYVGIAAAATAACDFNRAVVPTAAKLGWAVVPTAAKLGWAVVPTGAKHASALLVPCGVKVI